METTGTIAAEITYDADLKMYRVVRGDGESTLISVSSALGAWIAENG